MRHASADAMRHASRSTQLPQRVIAHCADADAVATAEVFGAFDN